MNVNELIGKIKTPKIDIIISITPPHFPKMSQMQNIYLWYVTKVLDGIKLNDK